MDYSKMRININERFLEFVPYLNDIYFLYDVDKKAKGAGISGQLDIYLSQYRKRISNFVEEKFISSLVSQEIHQYI